MTTKNAPEITENDRVIASMFVESTGTHMLDSGGTSGRMWQRNQAAVGEQDPAAYFLDTPVAKWFDVDTYPNRYWRDRPEYRGKPLKLELSATVSLFHYLRESLDFNAEADAEFQRWAELPENEHENWLALQDRFLEHYAAYLAREAWLEEFDRDGEDEEGAFTAEQVGNMSDEDIVEVCGYYEAPGGIYGDGKPFVEYTYNIESPLSQDFQFAYGTIKEEAYVVVSVHNGADARGGFTKPRVFTNSGYDGVEILDFARRLYMQCNECSATWDSEEGGYHWTAADWGHEQMPQVVDIEDYQVIVGDANTAEIHAANHPIGQAIKALRREHFEWLCEKAGVDPTTSRWRLPRDLQREYDDMHNVGSIVIDRDPEDREGNVYCPHCGKGTLEPGWIGLG